MDYISFANHLLQVIANERLPFIQNTINGQIDDTNTYKLIAGKIHGLTMAEDIVRRTAEQWINGAAQAPEVKAGIRPISVGSPSSTKTQSPAAE